MKKEYKQIKKNWYMTKSVEKTNKDKIQFIVKIKDLCIFMVSDWLTDEEINNIDLNKYNFLKYEELKEEHK